MVNFSFTKLTEISIAFYTCCSMSIDDISLASWWSSCMKVTSLDNWIFHIMSS